MVPLVKTESSLRMLVERLNWPVRLVRWQTARQFGALLSSGDCSELAADIYLDWLSRGQFESETASGLTVLFYAPESGLPSFDTIARSISRPSILADTMLQSVYGRGQVGEGLEHGHSAQVPQSFEPPVCFSDHKSRYAPPMFGSNFERLEMSTGFPFMRQWAFEWHELMELTNAPLYGSLHYFFKSARFPSDLTGQLMHRQCEVYQSAYLRTLACAANCEAIDSETAGVFALHALPLNRGLEQLNVTERPDWLHDIPEECFRADGEMEGLIRNLVKPGLGEKDMRPVAIRTPISVEISEFSDLSVLAVLASKDFVPDSSCEHLPLTDDLIWRLPDGISIDGILPKKDIEAFTSQGVTGACAPLCLNLWPYPAGLWLADYFLKGVLLPAPYVFHAATEVACRNDRIEIVTGDEIIAFWKFWHDCWTPLYTRGGSTRCGMLTELREDKIRKAEDRYGLSLAWLVELNIWKETDDGRHLESSRHREFFFD